MSNPFQHVQNIVTEEDRELIRKGFSENDPFRSYWGHEMVSFEPPKTELEKLTERIQKRFPGYKVFSAHYFRSEKERAVLSDWHNGLNFAKVFKGHPDLKSLWIPLQDVNQKTGGQLWFYNGPLAKQLEDISRAADKRSSNLQNLLLGHLRKELDAHAVTADVRFGEGLLFSMMVPHCVYSDSTGPREVVSIRLCEDAAELDMEFFDYLEKQREVWDEVESNVSALEELRSSQIAGSSDGYKQLVGELEKFCVSPMSLARSTAMLGATVDGIRRFAPDLVPQGLNPWYLERFVPPTQRREDSKNRTFPPWKWYA